MSRRTEIAEVLKAPKLNEQVTVMGWVKFKSKSNSFIHLNDGSTIEKLQIVVDYKNFDEDLLNKVTFHSCIKVTGQLVESQGAGQAARCTLAAAVRLGSLGRAANSQ